MQVLVVGLGGILGALARYGTALLLNQGALLPWGTLAVNLSGCFLLALFFTIALSRLTSDSLFVLTIATGFIGAFTTFSSVSVESVLLMRSAVHLALLYIGMTLALGYLCTWAGHALGHLILSSGRGRQWPGGISAGGKANE